MFAAKNYDCHFHKRQKINDSLGEEENPENKGSEQLKRKKYAHDINRQSTKEKKNANKKLHNLLANSENNNKTPKFQPSHLFKLKIWLEFRSCKNVGK